MLNQFYSRMLQEKDMIFEIFAYAQKRKAEAGTDQICDFSLGNPSVPAPDQVAESIRYLLASSDSLSLHGYSPSGGIPEVREKISADLNKRYSAAYTARHLFMTCGAASAIAHALRAVAFPGDEILTFAPCFSEYRAYASGAGCTLRIVPPDTDCFQIDLACTEGMINEKTAAVLINSPNNPSGVVYTADTIRQLSALLTRKSAELGHTIYLISDEPYRDILFSSAERYYTASLYPHTLTCYSYSKSLSLPGERIGYLAVWPECADAEQILEILPQISRTTGHNGAPVLWQRVAADCCSLSSDMTVYEKNKEILFEALTDFGYQCAEPGGTFYMFPRSPIPDASAFCRKAMASDLMLVPGDGFSCPGHFRIAYCVPEEVVRRSLPVFKHLIRSL